MSVDRNSRPSVRASGVPPIEPRDLRQGMPSAMLERVWRRLEPRLERGAQQRSRAVLPTSAVGSTTRSLWGAVMTAAVFGAGVWVGRGPLQPEPVADVQLTREPVQSAAGNNAAFGLPSTALAEPSLPRSPHGERPERARSKSVRGNRAEPSTRPDPVVAAPVPLAVEEVDTVDSSVSVAAPPAWQSLANGGEYEAAWFELSAGGGFEAALDEASAEQLMLLADVARATGQRQRAIVALRRVVSEFASEPVAPLAAWTLGGLLLKAGDEAGAMEAFAVYRSLSPEGDFAEDALVRQIRAAVERGDREQVQVLMAQYEQDFPSGRRRSEVERWLEEGVDAHVDAGVGSRAVSEQVPSPSED